MHNERRNRIRISIAAYAYEFKGRSIMTQFDYDELSDRIHPEANIGDETDEFFRDQYLPYETNWIHWHPKLEQIEQLYKSLYQAGG